MTEALALPPDLLCAMQHLAAAARPREACGLLLGQGARVLALAPSRNLAEAADAFEIDAALQLRLHRQLRGSGQAVTGIWHSHPCSAAVPSARDLAGAWDETLAWVITGTDRTRAWRIADGRPRELALFSAAPTGARLGARTTGGDHAVP